jgi:hypothetical protein
MQISLNIKILRCCSVSAWYSVSSGQIICNHLSSLGHTCVVDYWIKFDFQIWNQIRRVMSWVEGKGIGLPPNHTQTDIYIRSKWTSTGI